MSAIDPVVELRRSIRRLEVAEIQRVCQAYPSIVTDHIPAEGRLQAWTCFAVQHGNQEILGVLLDCGFNIDAVNLPEQNTALVMAAFNSDVAMFEYLLRRGANPNIGRPVIAALNCDDVERRLPMIRLLVEHGLDVNKLYDLYGDVSKSFTALDWAKDPEIVKYLKEHGAKHAVRSKSTQQVADHEAKQTVYTSGILWLDGENADMAAAVREAQQTFCQFRDKLKGGASAVDDCGVKVFFPSAMDPRVGEHMWVNELAFGPDGIEATLCNDAGWLQGLANGDRVSFTLDRVSDWFFVDNGVVHGGFTIKLLLRQFTPQQFADCRNEPPACYFADWYDTQHDKPGD